MSKGRASSQEPRRGRFGLVAIARTLVADVRSRTFAATALATAWDFSYATYLDVAGHAAGSPRMVMTSMYYFSLVAVGACALMGYLTAGRCRDEPARDRAEGVAALVGSILLLSSHAVMAFVIRRAEKGWDASDYTEASYYMLTTYALVMLFLTVSGWRRHRRDRSLVVSLAKGLALCKALMTLYLSALAAAQRYGGDGRFLHMMLSGTAGSVGVGVVGLSFAISVFTLVRSARGLWAQHVRDTGGSGGRE